MLVLNLAFVWNLAQWGQVSGLGLLASTQIATRRLRSCVRRWRNRRILLPDFLGSRIRLGVFGNDHGTKEISPTNQLIGLKWIVYIYKIVIYIIDCPAIDWLLSTLPWPSGPVYYCECRHGGLSIHANNRDFLCRYFFTNYYHPFCSLTSKGSYIQFQPCSRFGFHDSSMLQWPRWFSTSVGHKRRVKPSNIMVRDACTVPPLQGTTLFHVDEPTAICSMRGLHHRKDLRVRRLYLVDKTSSGVNTPKK